jgi:hypothetical protein
VPKMDVYGPRLALAGPSGQYLRDRALRSSIVEVMDYATAITGIVVTDWSSIMQEIFNLGREKGTNCLKRKAISTSPNLTDATRGTNTDANKLHQT